MEQLSLRELERRAALFHGDGLLDIGIGIGILALGVIMVFGLGPAAGISVIALVPVVRSLRRRITFPRMYHIDFIPDPYTGSHAHRIGMFAVVAGILVVGLLVFLRAGIVPAPLATWLRANTIVALSLLLGCLLLAVAWGTGVRRLFAYALITFLALVCGYWFDVAPPYYFMALGLFILFCGSTVLARFVRKYPKLDPWS